MALKFKIMLWLLLQLCKNKAQESFFVASSRNFTSRNELSSNAFYRIEMIFTTFDTHQLVMRFDATYTNGTDVLLMFGNGNISNQHILLNWDDNPGSDKIQILSSGNAMWLIFKYFGRAFLSGTVKSVAASENEIDCGEQLSCSNGVCISREYRCSPLDIICANESHQHMPCIEFLTPETTFNFTSVNFPSKYPNNHQQEIIFTTLDTHRLLLSFDFMHTEFSHDYVRVGDGNISNEQVLLTWSGGPAVDQIKVISAKSTLWLNFTTDNIFPKEGFSGVVRPVRGFQAEHSVCGNNFNCMNGACIPWKYACTRDATYCGNRLDESGCNAKYCLAPKNRDVKLRFKPVAKDFENGTEIKYACEEGYAVNGTSKAVCLYGYWIPSKLPGCEAFDTLAERVLNISNVLSQEIVTSNYIKFAAKTIEIVTRDDEFVKKDPGRFELIMTSLELVVTAQDPSDKVTEPVVLTINNLMNFHSDVLQRRLTETGREVAALEQQILNSQKERQNYTLIFENVGVSTIVINTTRVRRNLGFAVLSGANKTSVLNADLTEDTSRIFWDNDVVPFEETLVLMSMSSTFCDMVQCKGENESTEVPVSFIIYSNSRLFTPSKPLKPAHSDVYATSDSNVTEKIASRIFSVVSAKDAILKKRVGTPLKTKFKTDLTTDTDEKIEDIECVFWNYDHHKGEGHWSKNGCRKMPDEADLTRVRKRLYKSEEPLHYITLVGSTISCISLVLCIITFTSLKKLRSKQATHIHINLCVSLLGFYIAFLLSTVVVSNPVLCAISSAAIHFFTLSTVAWMSVEAINMYILFVEQSRTRFRNFIKVACAFGYGCPFVLSIVVAVLDNNSDYYSALYCFIHPGFAFYFGFLAEVIALFIFNFIIFICLIRKMLCRPLMASRTKENARRNEIITRVGHGILFWFIFGLSWSFGFAAAVDSRTPIFQYCYCTCISLQGFVLFLLLSAANPTFRKTVRDFIGSRGDVLLSSKSTSASSSRITNKSVTKLQMEKNPEY